MIPFPAIRAKIQALYETLDERDERGMFLVDTALADLSVVSSFLPEQQEAQLTRMMREYREASVDVYGRECSMICRTTADIVRDYL